MSSDLPQTSETIIESLKHNVSEKQKVIDRALGECLRLKSLNHACFATMHRMHYAYSKPNLN